MVALQRKLTATSSQHVTNNNATNSVGTTGSSGGHSPDAPEPSQTPALGKPKHKCKTHLVKLNSIPECAAPLIVSLFETSITELLAKSHVTKKLHGFLLLVVKYTFCRRLGVLLVGAVRRRVSNLRIPRRSTPHLRCRRRRTVAARAPLRHHRH